MIEYRLEQAKENNIDQLIQYKLDSILDYAMDIEEKEKEKIKNYVIHKVPEQIKNYKVITLHHQVIGCLLLEKYEDGVLLDEIYLEKENRGKKIGTNIIQNVLKQHNIVYLWVYKENKSAIKLYKKLGFQVEETTETRFFMKHQNS